MRWIRRDTESLSVFSSNAGKYGPEKQSSGEIWNALAILAWFKNLLKQIKKRW